MTTLIRILIIVSFFLAISPCSQGQQRMEDRVRSVIEFSATTNSPILLGQDSIYNRSSVISFYEQSQYKLAWRRHRDIMALLSTIRNAADEGLISDDYHASLLDKFYYKRRKSDSDIVFFDFLLTDAFFQYSSHMVSGKTNPLQLYSFSWEASLRQVNMVDLLRNALDDHNVLLTLEKLKPDYAGYRKLKSALASLKRMEAKGGWVSVPSGETLESGMIDYRIPLIRKRLAASGQLPSASATDSLLYDSALCEGVKRFQREHGLKEDGVIGRNTLTSLNYAPEYYIRKIILNLERYRWLPQHLGDRYVFINIPSFSLDVIEYDTAVMSMNVIIGRPERKTPILSSTIKYLILNPTWIVPPTILREDVLPAVKKDIGYLKRHNLRVVDRMGQEIDPAELPWATYSGTNFPYLLRQDPGLYNSMGLIKFQFPNRHSIFLHDTNLRMLFSETDRALSSGCIRVHYPFALASYLLEENTLWSMVRVNEVISSGKTETVVFQWPLPVHILYFTAFVDDIGTFHVRNDIYGYDDILLRSFNNVYQ